MIGMNIIKNSKLIQIIGICLVLGLANSCSSDNLSKAPVESQASANVAEQPVVTEKENTDNKGESNKQEAARDITYNPTTPEDNDAVKDQKSFIEHIRYVNIPYWVRKSFFDKGLNKSYSIHFRDIRQLYLRGDFNGDNKIDIALMLAEKKPQGETQVFNRAMAIFHGGTQEVILIDKELGADDVWEVIPKAEAAKYNASIPSSWKQGEGISLSKAASSSRLFYWDGKQYTYYATSD
ncbi:hypothetical protein [Trichocoleus sp. FACHB-40]|uniref:hypothetical protein n=2 Tax=Cyanophyceae TaxID=3028117 RepID=UPI001687DE45|nr:hypothetical protein [Trichocoleus sp. FACHB-40]